MRYVYNGELGTLSGYDPRTPVEPIVATFTPDAEPARRAPVMLTRREFDSGSRAGWGSDAVRVGTPDYALSDDRDSIVDTLANVLLYASALGIDLYEVAGVALMHADNETEPLPGEDGPADSNGYDDPDDPEIDPTTGEPHP